MKRALSCSGRQPSLFDAPAPSPRVKKCRTTLVRRATKVLAGLGSLPLDERVAAINAIKLALHEQSPFATEPVDCVLWIPTAQVQANDYNPNSVAPPEMQLLARSIEADGYTQPVVAWAHDGIFEVVDGFHRNRVAREVPSIGARVHGYLPLAVINTDRQDRGDRIASTIRHNRARGRHAVEAMSDIVVELKRRNWTDERIGKELGMDADEVLRLTQVSGLAEMFQDQDFSAAWEIGDDDGSFVALDDVPDGDE